MSVNGWATETCWKPITAGFWLIFVKVTLITNLTFCQKPAVVDFWQVSTTPTLTKHTACNIQLGFDYLSVVPYIIWATQLVNNWRLRGWLKGNYILIFHMGPYLIGILPCQRQYILTCTFTSYTLLLYVSFLLKLMNKFIIIGILNIKGIFYRASYQIEEN